MPPSYVRPYVRRVKTDATDAEAICEVVTRPNMRVTPEACVRHDAGQNGRAAIGADDAQFEAIGGRASLWYVS